MSIVTKAGDGGETRIIGGTSVSKDDARLHAYGTVDELNALLGVVLSRSDLSENLRASVVTLQHELFTLGADLASPLSVTVPRMTEKHVKRLDDEINAWESHLPALTQFILPGGSEAGAVLHHARTVCRRAERWMVTLQHHEPINPQSLIYANRLSDYLFLAARIANDETGIPEETVRYN